MQTTNSNSRSLVTLPPTEVTDNFLLRFFIGISKYYSDEITTIFFVSFNKLYFWNGFRIYTEALRRYTSPRVPHSHFSLLLTSYVTVVTLLQLMNQF